MKLKELKESEWFQQRPEVIQQAIDKRPPTQLYKFKDSGKQCGIISYEEPEKGKLEDVTCTVVKTGKGGPLEVIGLSIIDKDEQVFDVSLDDLEVWDD